MKEEILNLLAEVANDDSIKENLDCDLFEEGLIDSVTVAELLVSIEEKFNVVISPSEIDRNQINTANKIIDLTINRIEK